MKKYFTLLIILLSMALKAQPGYVKKSFRINEIPEDYIALHKENPHVYRLDIIIDNDHPDIEKVNLIKDLTYLNLDIQTEKIPAIFNEVNFANASTVNILGSKSLKDISNIKGFQNAEELSVSNFEGKKLPSVLSEFKNLQLISINHSDYLENIDAIKDLENLKTVNLDCQHLKSFPIFSEQSKIQHIILQKVRSDVDFSGLSSIPLLGRIEISIAAELNHFPDCLSQNLSQIIVNGNIKSISSIEKYPKLEYLQIGSTEFESFNIDLSKNEKVNNISLMSNLKMKNIDGIYTAKYLQFLYLSNLPFLKEFDLKSLDLKKGLSIISTGVTSLHPIEKIKMLSFLHIQHNDFLSLKDEFHENKITIFNNGKLVKQ